MTSDTGFLIADRLLPRGTRLAAVLLADAPHIALDWDVRQKSRFDATDSHGRLLGVFLPRGTVVRGGDVLVARDGSLVRVEAAPQEVMVVRPDPVSGNAFDLVRAAYHLGNRHVQLALLPDRLMLEPDHVLAAMIEGLGLTVSTETVGFEPESGAYSTDPGRRHGHRHDHPHEHEHGHGHGHTHHR